MHNTHSDPVLDAQRLAVLHATNLVDSPPEVSFDRLTQLASKLLKSPASVVSLVDADRQFFKSCVGLPEPWASSREIELSHSFCKLAVQTDSPLIVDDSRLDDRVKDNPSVTALGVRSYAGVPVRAKSGEVLGTFCVFDIVPREWSESDIEILETLAASVESEIELVSVSAREKEHLQLLETMIKASPLAVAVIDDDSNVHLWNEAAESMFGYQREEVLGKPLPIVPPEKDDECKTVRGQLSEGIIFQGYATYHCNKNNDRIHVKIAAARLNDFEGESGRSLLIFDDVSAQVEADQEREELLRRLQQESSLREALLNQLPSGVVVAEVPTGAISFVNEKALELGEGMPSDTFNLETLASYTGYHPNGRQYGPNEWPLARTILEGEIVSNEEILLQFPDGSYRSLLTSSKLVEDGDGQASTAITTFTDITELKESESARHRSEEKARQIIASSQDCIKILDIEGHLVSMSAGGQRILEIDNVEELYGELWIDFWKGMDRENAKRAVEEAVNGRSGRFRGICPTMRSQTNKWWDVIVTPILGEDGKPEQLLSISRDVTETVVAEEEREALIKREIHAREAAEIAEEKYRNLVDGLDAIVWEANAKTWEFSFVSQRAEEILGYPIEQWLGDSSFWPSIIHPEDRDPSITLCRTACDECRDHDFEYRAVTNDGRTVWLRDIVYVVPDENGEPNHLRGVMVDVSAMKKLEQELRERAELLSEMDDRKNQFLAVLAHELRNPLAPIGNAAELLGFCSEDPEQILEIREILQGQVSQMVRLIDDLMDISRITRGKINLEKKPVNIVSVLETSITSVRPSCQNAGHTLNTAINIDENLTVMGDQVRLAQVFINILNNACKYTPPGGTILLECCQVENDVEISIEDNGIGISQEDAKNIFEMFTQVESSITRSQGGLGIGLTLVKQLVEMHDGSVSLAERESETGSKFIVRLPLTASSTKSSARIVSSNESGKLNVLVIDDLAPVANLLRLLIKAMGHHVTVALSAKEGIEAARQSNPQVIFSDICMPEMSGYEVAQILRSMEELDHSMIVAMTGNGQPEDIKKAYQAGFDRHLVKPASVDMLKSVFEEYWSQSSV